MAKKKKGKKGKKNKGPQKPPHIIVLEYLVDSSLEKKRRLNAYRDEWTTDNQELQLQVESLTSELEATIAYMRRQEGAEKQTCADTAAQHDAELRAEEDDLAREQRNYDQKITALNGEFGDTNDEVEDVETQVQYWKNYPSLQSVEKKQKIKLLKIEIQHVDKVYDAFEEQLDGNFRYMQSFLQRHHVTQLELAKQTAAERELRRVSLSDHSDLSGQETLCLQSVLNQERGSNIRHDLDCIINKNARLQRALVPLRLLEPLEPSAAPMSTSEQSCDAVPAGLAPPVHLDSLTELLTAQQPSSAQTALVAQLRDHTLKQLRPDEDELRARALAARARRLLPPTSDANSAGSVDESEPGSADSGFGQDELLPFESPLKPAAGSLARQALRPFERFRPRPRWWRVHVPEPPPRTWPVTEPQLALYAEQPTVFDLAGPKVINESPSVSSAHISDEWQLSKTGWLEHLRRRSALTVTPADSGEQLPTSATTAKSGNSAKPDNSSGGRTRDGSFRKPSAKISTSKNKLNKASSSKSVTAKTSSSKNVTSRGNVTQSVASAIVSSQDTTMQPSSSKNVGPILHSSINEGIDVKASVSQPDDNA